MNTILPEAFHDLVLKARSYRRFAQEPVAPETLLALVELARLSPSGGNGQRLKFMLSCRPETNRAIFDHVAWAGYLTDWAGPAEGERPTAYIVLLLDRELGNGAGCDHGIAAQSIVLGAMTRGLGACMIGSIRRKELGEALHIPDRYEILLIVALGKPGEHVVVEDTGPEGGIEYYRDADDVHHVPKRPLTELVVDMPAVCASG